MSEETISAQIEKLRFDFVNENGGRGPEFLHIGINQYQRLQADMTHRYFPPNVAGQPETIAGMGYEIDYKNPDRLEFGGCP